MDTSVPTLPIKMADIERIEEEAQNPGKQAEDTAEYIRELITAEIYTGAEDIASVLSDLQSLIAREEIPDHIQRDFEGHLHDLEGAVDHVMDHAREEFKSDTTESRMKNLASRSRAYSELTTLARDQQHALQKYRNRIRSLVERMEHLEATCEQLQDENGRMESQIEALGPLAQEV